MSRQSTILPHHNLDKATLRIKLATVRAQIDWLAPNSFKETQRLKRAINVK